ncbi:hypothetical protein ACFQMA_19205 [Halosimplex aquaticum]|uniref:HEAT repeat-containing protein n=1 Tax=Halosimplex aquaticum TaxID=3026162 RepID=A0ABD5Y3Z8_9EURY|nr:hypothetical protein [Halosimplex aquaticum]
MKRVLVALAVLIGTLGIAAALALAVVLTPVTATEAGAGAALVALAGGVIAVAKLYRSADDETVAPAPWTDDAALVAGMPEETADPADVTGEAFAKVVDEACERAAAGETVEDGFEVVRPRLREALTRVLVAGGTDREGVEDLLASGAWTDDPVAAAVLDERVEPPRRSLRGRIRAWLFPERIVRRQAARAVAAIADAADEELPPVVGQRAPRTVPTLAPALGSLQRSVDGTLQRASASPSVDSAADASGEATGGDAIDTDADGDATDGDAPPDTDDGDAEVAELVGEVWDDA